MAYLIVSSNKEILNSWILIDNPNDAEASGDIIVGGRYQMRGIKFGSVVELVEFVGDIPDNAFDGRYLLDDTDPENAMIVPNPDFKESPEYYETNYFRRCN